MSTSAEVVNVCKSSDIQKNIESNDTTAIHLINVDKSLIDNDNKNQCLPVQIINGQKLTIANNSDNILLPSTSKMPRQSNLPIKEVKEFKDIDFILSKKIIGSSRITELSSKIIDKPFINKNIEVSKNDSNETGADQMIGEIKPKISLNRSKRQLEELDIKSNKSKRMNNYSNSKVNTNDSIERNLDEMFEGYQEKSIEKEPELLTQQLTDILESSELENSSNIDFNSSTLSPTLGTRKSNVKIKNRRRTMLFEKSCTMLQTNKSKDNLNDTIEQNLNEIFKNTDNTVRTYESDGMLTQQLKSVLQSQNNSQLFNDENITEKKSLSLSTNSGKKHRLSLSINLNNSFGSEIENENSTILNKMLTLDPNKQETTLQKSNIDNDSQDTEIYFANIKSNKKKTFIITSQSEDELGDFQSLDGNDKEIVKKQENERLSSENIKESDMLVKCNQSNDNFLNKIETDTSKVRPKKRISLSLSKKVNLNYSQGSLSDLEVEQKFSRKEDYKSTMSRINTSNEPETIPTDVLNNPKSRRTSFDKVCTPNNTNLFIKEIANTDDCVSSDDDFLRSMPEIKVAGTVDCPATSSQLAAPSDDDYDDEETTIVPISPTDIVIPTKWNWYAKKRYDLIYQKNRSDIKIENNNDIQTGSQSKKTQISGINNILTRIESASKRHNSKNSRHLIVTKEENIRRSTRSRHVHEANSIETFPTIINDNSDSNSDIESSSILERIIPKYKTLEPVKLDLVRYATDDSDEEFELLRKRCERMLAAPRVYKNLLAPDKNLKQTKVKNKNTKTRYTKKGNRGSLKISCSYTDDDEDEDDDDDIHSRRNISKKTRIADEDALVFQISTGDSKEYSKFRMSKLGTTPNKKETKADIDDSNRPELLKNSGIKNNRQHLKLQEVSPIDINTTTTRVKGLLKSNIKLDDTSRMKRSRNNIENKAEPTRTRNQAMLNTSRIKRPTLHRLAKNKSITQFNELSNEVTMPTTPSTSRKRNSRNTSELPISSSLTSSKCRRSISSPLIQTPYKILFTGDKSKTYTETVTKLGGYITEDPAKCSILVTDKIRRTFKFLCSVARGIPIVSLKWLDDSNKSHYFLEWKNYILKDVATESRLKFKLMESLKKAENHKLFVGYTIILTPNITQPPISELKEMITFSGGKCLLRTPRNWQEKTVVITQADDIEHAKKIIKKAPISVTIHSKEFLLTGILKQEINLIEYKVSI
ncbi:PREDICTED: uncharacterized protein LOC105360010 [Ceratosolen solmsi marchali]|uniref:PAX-interacting protein 1 n=1 Tax=Ceratosolen solmsi marchali TaxID=326594 RepID=A0AAJ6VMF8_9HYME|nr:PREDICTED: uncharacterized protein LOC105360010 [Ceratosolen solmsi marchali]